MLTTVFLTALIGLGSVNGSPADNSTVYFSGLETTLNAAGLGYFWNALSVANGTSNGQSLINGLYTDDKWTLYAPVDLAWEASNLTNVSASEDLVSLLSYHMVKTALNSSTDIAPSRSHTIAQTMLRSSTVLLPGEQKQVIVLETNMGYETDQSPSNTSILIRGDSWNATSNGEEIGWSNLDIQPIDKVLTVPSPLMKTLAQSGLAMAANMGATNFSSLITSLNLSDLMEDCYGCTFFVPVNDAFTTAAQNSNYSSLSDTEKKAVLENHILNGTVAYYPTLSSGSVYVTAAGKPLIYLTDEDSGSSVSVGGYSANFLRSDIPVANGVVHLVDTVMIETLTDEAGAESAVSSASSSAAIQASTGATSTSTASTATTTGTTATSTANAAPSMTMTCSVLIKTTVLVVVLGAFWH